MDNVVDNFNIEIKELRDHLNYIENISNEISNTSPLFPYVNSLTKKKFNYNSLIISLYGIVENYSEKFIVKYLENISLIISEYPNLKNSIKKKNIYNSASLTLKVIEKKLSKYSHLKENDLITNLNTCLTNLPNYSLNFESFTMLLGNMKHSRMCELFSQIDIDLNQSFIKHTEFNLSSSENQFIKLDELVDMRNEVAHGNVSTLLTPNQVQDYVDFIEKYFKNLHKILAFDLEQEKLKYWKTNHSIQLENTIVFTGNIIGFNNVKNIKVDRNSLIIIHKKDQTFKLASIEEVRTFPNNDITLKLNSNSTIKENQLFYIKTEELTNNDISHPIRTVTIKQFKKLRQAKKKAKNMAFFYNKKA